MSNKEEKSKIERDILIFKYIDDLNVYQQLDFDANDPIRDILDSDSILAFVDQNRKRVWIWHGSNTTTRMKFNAAKLAPSLRDKHGIGFKISAVDQGIETLEFIRMLGIDQQNINAEINRGSSYKETMKDLELLGSLSRENILSLLEEKGFSKAFIKKMVQDLYWEILEQIKKKSEEEKITLLLNDRYIFESLEQMSVELKKINSELQNLEKPPEKDSKIGNAISNLNKIIDDLNNRFMEKMANLNIEDEDKRKDDERGFYDYFPYPYILKPPKPPDDLGLTGEVKAKKSVTEQVFEYAPYCKYCGALLAKGESICHVCGNKVD